jgi:hypothetical protein
VLAEPQARPHDRHHEREQRHGDARRDARPQKRAAGRSAHVHADLGATVVGGAIPAAFGIPGPRINRRLANPDCASAAKIERPRGKERNLVTEPGHSFQ